MESKYEGWTNYETWATALWVDNDEGTYYERKRRVGAVVREALAKWSASPRQEEFTQYEFVAHRVSKDIKQWISEEMIPDLGASLASDLLNYALEGVNWLEIADHWLDGVELGQEEEAC